MQNCMLSIRRGICLLKLPTSSNHVISCINHAVKLDYITILINKLKFATQVSPNIV